MNNKSSLVLVIIFLLLLVTLYVAFARYNIFESKPHSNTIVTSGETTDANKITKGKRKNSVTIVVNNDIALLSTEAYHESCNMFINPILSIRENESWVRIDQKLPLYKSYYLDGVYHTFEPSPMCDMIAYWKIKSPIEIKLPTYTYIFEGVTEDPKNEDAFIEKFLTEEYRGDVKIELEYCTNSTCDSKEMFTAILNENREILSTDTTSVNNP